MSSANYDALIAPKYSQLSQLNAAIGHLFVKTKLYAQLDAVHRNVVALDQADATGQANIAATSAAVQSQLDDLTIQVQSAAKWQSFLLALTLGSVSGVGVYALSTRMRWKAKEIPALTASALTSAATYFWSRKTISG